MRRAATVGALFFCIVGPSVAAARAQLIEIPEKFQASLDAAVKRVPLKLPPLTAAPDVKTTLHKMADALGMLRGPAEEDGVLTADIWATGTLASGGQSCALASYRASVRYDVPAMRVDYSCVQGDGKPGPRTVQVVARSLAWDETEPGVGGTAAHGAASDRLVQLWTLPHAIVKAATAAGAETKVTLEAGIVYVSFPLPAPLNGTARVALNTTDAEELTMDDGHKYQLSYWIDRVETRVSDVLTETSYSGGYQDRNDVDYRSDVTFPRRIVQKRGATTLLDLTIERTNTYNPYVVMPVPASVRAVAPNASAPTK